MIKNHTIDGLGDQDFDVVEFDGLIRFCGESSQSYDNGIIDFNITNTSEFEIKLRQNIEYFSNKGKEFEWKFYDIFHPDWVIGILNQTGFLQGDEENLFLFDLNQEKIQSKQSHEIIVKEINTSSEFDDVSSLLNQVWQVDHSNLIFGLKAEISKSPDHVKMYGAYIEQTLVSVGWIRMYGGIGYLFGGSTLLQYRKKGAFSALVFARACIAKERGCRYLMVDASADSTPILNKLGFQKIGKTIAFTKE